MFRIIICIFMFIPLQLLCQELNIGRLTRAEQVIADTTKAITNQKKEIDDYQSQIRALTTSINTEQASITTIDNKINKTKASLGEKKEEYNKSLEANNHTKEARMLIESISKEIGKIEDIITNFEEEKSQHHAIITKNNKEVTNINSNILKNAKASLEKLYKKRAQQKFDLLRVKASREIKIDKTYKINCAKYSTNDACKEALFKKAKADALQQKKIDFVNHGNEQFKIMDDEWQQANITAIIYNKKIIEKPHWSSQDVDNPIMQFRIRQTVKGDVPQAYLDDLVNQELKELANSGYADTIDPAIAEAERKAQEEAARQARLEAERKAQEEAALKARARALVGEMVVIARGSFKMGSDDGAIVMRFLYIRLVLLIIFL